MVLPAPDAPVMPMNSPGAIAETQVAHAACGAFLAIGLVGIVHERHVVEDNGPVGEHRRRAVPGMVRRHRRQLAFQLLDHAIGRQRVGEALAALLHHAGQIGHAHDDVKQRNQRGRRDVKHAEPDQHQQSGDDARYRRQCQPRLGMLPLIVDLPRRQAAQRVAELTDEARLQVGGDGELQAAEELAGGIEQRQVLLGHHGAEAVRAPRHRHIGKPRQHHQHEADRRQPRRQREHQHALRRQHGDGDDELQQQMGRGADAQDVAAHDMGDARVAQLGQPVPRRGGELLDDERAPVLDEAGLQRGDAHVAQIDDRGAQGHHHPIDREQHHKLAEGRGGPEPAEHGGHRPLQPAGRSRRADDHHQQWDQEGEAQPLDHGAAADQR